MHLIRYSYKYLLVILLISLSSCSNKAKNHFQGYFEGEYLYIAPAVSGHLIHLNVSKGQVVAAGANLFNIEQDDQLAQVEQSRAQVLTAKSQYNDLQSGKRPAELDVIKAQIKQAIASQKLALINLKRDTAQFAIGAISKAQLDSSQTNYDVAVAKTKELENDLKTGRLPGRDQQIKAQAAQISYADATLKNANWKLSQTIGISPSKSFVYDTLYNEGEWVSAGSPIVILLPPGNLKVRFFVPENIIGKLKIGSKLSISCDGCKNNINMQISYISNQAEYTPPVIFSNETKNKLVFRVEAKSNNSDPITMHPGQPVEVVLND